MPGIDLDEDVGAALHTIRVDIKQIEKRSDKTLGARRRINGKPSELAELAPLRTQPCGFHAISLVERQTGRGVHIDGQGCIDPAEQLSVHGELIRFVQRAKLPVTAPGIPLLDEQLRLRLRSPSRISILIRNLS
jgi:hypothetical protein